MFQHGRCDRGSGEYLINEDKYFFSEQHQLLETNLFRGSLTIPFHHRLRLALKLIATGQLPARKLPEIPALSAEEVAEARSFFPLDKFFIFGHARSGTTMLVRLVRLHPQVHCNYQAHFFTRPPLLQSLVADPDVRQWLARRSNRWNRGQDLSPVVLRAAADFILEREARRAGKTIVGDKSPNNLMHGEAVRMMHSIYPDARLVYIVRDGRDAVLSHRIQAFIEFPEQLSKVDARIRDDFIKNPDPFLNGERSLFSASSLQIEARNWVRNVSETDMVGKELYGEQYFSLRYEDLLDRRERFSAAWEQMKALWYFLGADPDQPGLQDALEQEMEQNPDADYQQQKAGQIAQSVQKGKRGSWREVFTKQDQQKFIEVAGETLSKWRYL